MNAIQYNHSIRQAKTQLFPIEMAVVQITCQSFPFDATKIAYNFTLCQTIACFEFGFHIFIILEHTF